MWYFKWKFFRRVIFIFFNCLYFFSTLNWKKSVDNTTKFFDGKNLPCILIQNKIDLINDDEIDNEEEIKKFSNENYFDGFFRTSAKMGININESMDFLINNIIERIEKIKGQENENFLGKTRKNIILEKKNENNENINNNYNNCC